eukprot:362440-Chlamydomonas_euryale.AAC.1
MAGCTGSPGWLHNTSGDFKDETGPLTASGPVKGMHVFSTARQRGSSSGLCAVTKGTPVRTVLSHAIPTGVQ